MKYSSVGNTIVIKAGESFSMNLSNIQNLFHYSNFPDYALRLIFFIRLKEPGAAGTSIYRISGWTSCSFTGRPPNNGPSNRSSLSQLKTTPFSLSSDDKHKNPFLLVAAFTGKQARLSGGGAILFCVLVQQRHKKFPEPTLHFMLGF